jgi:hypothetical protein
MLLGKAPAGRRLLVPAWNSGVCALGPVRADCDSAGMVSPRQSFGTKSAGPCNRRHPRHAVMLAGSALAVTRSRSVVVADLSKLGARLGGRDLPSPGDELLVVVGSTDRMGTVIWRSGDQCGVELDEVLAPDNIQRMKQEADWAAVTGWGR